MTVAVWPSRQRDVPLFPIALKLSDRPVAVIGAGGVAQRKIRELLRCGALVTVIAPEATEEIVRRRDAGELVWRARAFEDADLDGMGLVFAATAERAVNLEVVRAAHARGLLVNVADVPDLCDFYLPAVERRGAVTVAVSSGGCSPALAGQLVRELGQALPATLERYTELLAEARAQLLKRYPDDPARRHRLGRALVRGEARGLLEQGREDEARAVLQRIVDGDDEPERTSE